MAEYFVDLGATTNGTGTELSPYNSFAAFSSSVSPGTRIAVRRGTSKVLTSGTRLNVTLTGPGSVLVDTYGDGAPPVLSGGGTNFNPIYVKRVDGGARLVIRDLDVTRAPNHGIAIESAVGVTISNVLIQGCRAYGNNVLSSYGKDAIFVGCFKDGGLISNVVIDCCDVFDNNGHGIKVRDNTSNILVRNCRSWGNGVTTPSHGMGTCATAATVASAGAWAATSGGAYQASISTTALAKSTITQWLAVYCGNQNGYFWLTPSASSPPPLGSFYTGGSNTLEINVGAAPSAATVYASYLPVEGTFLGCDVWGTIDFNGLEGHGFSPDQLTSTFRMIGCRSRQNEGAGWYGNFSQAAILMGNAIDGNLKSGMESGGAKSTTAYNNTVINNASYGFRVLSGGTGTVLRNNIFADNAGYGISASSPSYTIDEDYNCVYGNAGGAKENVSTSGANGRTDDPLLDAAYRLASTSPCRRAGTYVSGAKHMGGASMNPLAPDIGAFRYRAQAAQHRLRAPT